MSGIQLPEDRTLAKKLIDSQTRQQERRTEMGTLGRFFGSVQDKPGNVACFAIAASFLILLVVVLVYISGDRPNLKIEILIPAFVGIISLALGYMFGKGTS